ncbi:purple acid phosphatase 2 [Artemisia annua]|uniref:Purple acid phosphatase 2 n=1 Tax=Artemisia annua TaxID=35608 RepID=A0A2U1NKD2_ARTAN|nr:purple acid phosphatase 2 [Artemisia annua]
MFEPWFVEDKVDLVFAGHVHSYERSEHVSNAAYNILNRECSPVKNLSATVYITIGDGDNIEGFRSTLSEGDEKLLISGDDGILMDLGMSSIQNMHMDRRRLSTRKVGCLTGYEYISEQVNMSRLLYTNFTLPKNQMISLVIV